MGMKLMGGTAAMAVPRNDIVAQRRPRSTEAVSHTIASGHTAVERQPHHVLKVMVVVTGRERSDGLELAMRPWGYEVGAAHDGTTALAMARAISPDVTIVEIESPRFCRCRLARRLRSELARPDSLIIAVTKQSDRECRRHCREGGIDVVLCLPVDSSVLETLLWMESTRLNRMLWDTAGGSGLRHERLHGPESVEQYGVSPYGFEHAEVTYQQVALLERIREAAGQTS